MKVTVLNIRDMNMPDAKTLGNLRALADIQVGPLVIYKCRLIKQPMSRAYVSPPQQEYMVGNDIRYTPLVKWPDEWKQPILEAVWGAYEAQRSNKETA